MTLWQVIILGSAAVLALKVAGYLVPTEVIARPAPSRVLSLLTVALLAALVVVQTLESAGAIVIDARVPAVLVAGVLLALRAPFVVVIIAAALVAALLRLTGTMA
jgi:hypothetical protein